jgi:phage tail tape-measure protein
MNLGNALSTLGSRESGTARLGEAVAAYRAALEGAGVQQATPQIDHGGKCIFVQS